MNTHKVVMAGALCALALITMSLPAHGDSLTPADRAYCRKIANMADHLHTDLYMFGWIGITKTKMDEATFHSDLQIICWHLHHDVKQALAVRPTPRFAPSNRVYDASLRRYDSARRLLLLSVAETDPAFALSIQRQADKEIDAGNQDAKEWLVLLQGETH